MEDLMLLRTNDESQPPTAARVLITLGNRVGLHARPAGAFVRVAKGFQSQIRVVYGAHQADGKSLLGILSLDAGQGAFLKIEAFGSDAAAAVRALHELILANCGEPD
jgi:phosphotransferase system HPr (HPr) family protein